MVPTHYHLILSAILFTIGTMGVLLRRNTIIIFMSVELMLNAVTLSFVALAQHWGSMDRELMVFFVMAVAAAEAAVGLAIILMVFRTKETVNADELNLMRGEPTKSLWNTHTPQRKQLYTLFPTFAGLSSFPSSASSSIS